MSFNAQPTSHVISGRTLQKTVTGRTLQKTVTGRTLQKTETGRTQQKTVTGRTQQKTVTGRTQQKTVKYAANFTIRWWGCSLSWGCSLNLQSPVREIIYIPAITVTSSLLLFFSQGYYRRQSEAGNN